MRPDLQLRRDLIKLVCLLAALLGAATVFVVAPALATPTLLSLVASTLLSPFVAALERRGYPRALSIGLLYLGMGGLVVGGGVWVIQSYESEWSSLRETGPARFSSMIHRLRSYETAIKSKYTFTRSINPTETLVAWAENESRSLMTSGPALLGDLLTWIFIVPFITFVLLSDGRNIRSAFFQLVPNRYFELFFLISHQISSAISDYLRAKMLEAFIVGAMTTVGLFLVGSNYALLLGILAGATNVIPYLGPLLGALPGLLIAGFDESRSGLAWGVGAVYLVANVVDTVVIFPLVVAKLVNLHPLFLVAGVIVGQQTYGLVGMLVSIPIVSAVKVVLQEIYVAVYEQRPQRLPGPTEPGVQGVVREIFDRRDAA